MALPKESKELFSDCHVGTVSRDKGPKDAQVDGRT